MLRYEAWFNRVGAVGGQCRLLRVAGRDTRVFAEMVEDAGSKNVQAGGALPLDQAPCIRLETLLCSGTCGICSAWLGASCV